MPGALRPRKWISGSMRAIITFPKRSAPVKMAGTRNRVADMDERWRSLISVLDIGINIM
jgi:hypothetical protein